MISTPHILDYSRSFRVVIINIDKSFYRDNYRVEFTRRDDDLIIIESFYKDYNLVESSRRGDYLIINESSRRDNYLVIFVKRVVSLLNSLINL